MRRDNVLSMEIMQRRGMKRKLRQVGRNERLVEYAYDLGSDFLAIIFISININAQIIGCILGLTSPCTPHSNKSFHTAPKTRETSELQANNQELRKTKLGEKDSRVAKKISLNRDR